MSEDLYAEIFSVADTQTADGLAATGRAFDAVPEFSGAGSSRRRACLTASPTPS